MLRSVVSAPRIAPIGLPGPVVELAPAELIFPSSSHHVTWAAAGFRVIEEVGPASSARDGRTPYPIPESLHSAAPRRLASFLAGRGVASAALYQAGFRDREQPIGRLASGAPQWPAGWVGSIAHTDSLCVAAVAESSIVSCLGIDCELMVSQKIASEVGKSIAPELTARRLDAAFADFPYALTAAFAAKESLYKALFPEVGAFFGFEAAEVESMDAEAGMLRLRLTQALSPRLPAGRVFECRWVVQRDHVIAVVEVTSLGATTP